MISLQERKSNAYLLSRSEQIYMTWTLKMRCTRYVFCGQNNLQEHEDNFFWGKLSRVDNVSGRVQKKS